MTPYVTSLSLSCALIFASACGDNIEEFADDGGEQSGDDVTPGAGATAFALGSDTTSIGTLTKILVPQHAVEPNVISGVAHSDSVLRHFDDKLYIINRFGADNITVVDPETSQLVTQISTGNGTNPQDLAVIDNLLYICAFNSGDIIILDVNDENAVPETIDISAYDPDGVPNCSSIAVVNGKIFAAIGALNESFSSQAGTVIVIDPETNTITSDFDLSYNNPSGFFYPTDPDGPFLGSLLISTSESFDDANGCVEKITTGPVPASAGCLIENSELGGFATHLHVADQTVTAAVNTSFTSAKLVRVDAKGILDDRSITPPEQHVTDFTGCPAGELITNDRMTGSIHIYGADGIEQTPAGLDIGLPAAYANGMVCF